MSPAGISTAATAAHATGLGTRPRIISFEKERIISYLQSFENAFYLKDLIAAKKAYEADLQTIVQQTVHCCSLGHAFLLYELGNVLQSLGMLPAAKETYANALTIYRLPEYRNSLAHTSALYELGNVLYDLGEFLAARNIYAEALTIYETSEHRNSFDHALTLYKFGNMFQMLGAPHTAMQVYRKAQEIYNRPENQHARKLLESYSPPCIAYSLKASVSGLPIFSQSGSSVLYSSSSTAPAVSNAADASRALVALSKP